MADNSSNSTNKLKEEAKQNILDKDGIVAESTSVEVELIQTPNNVTSRKRTSSSGKERWSKLSQSVTKSEAISEDTKRVMAAYHALDDLTVLPTKMQLWSHQDAKSNTLIIVLPAIVTALWLAIPLNPWGYEKWNEKNIGNLKKHVDINFLNNEINLIMHISSGTKNMNLILSVEKSTKKSSENRIKNPSKNRSKK